MLAPSFKMLHGAGHAIYMALLCCGAVLTKRNNAEVLKGLFDECVRPIRHSSRPTHRARLYSLHLTYGFAFKADAIQASVVGPLFMTFAHRHLIEGATLANNHAQLGELVASAPYLARHSSIVFYIHSHEVTEKKVRTVKESAFIEVGWTHVRIRPAGQDVPLQCEDCGALLSHKVTERSDDKNAGTYYERKCNVQGCKHYAKWEADKDWEEVPVEKAKWLFRLFRMLRAA